MAISKSGPLKTAHANKRERERGLGELQWKNFCSEFAELLINLKQLKGKYFKNARVIKQSYGQRMGPQVKYLKILLKRPGQGIGEGDGLKV